MDYVKKHNENPTVYTWTKDADTIPAKVAKCKEVLGTVHEVNWSVDWAR